MRWLSASRAALNKEDRAFKRQAATAVEAVFGSKRCPCCRRVMEKPKRTGRQPSTTRTMAHDTPVMYGGSVWVYTCLACNSEQGRRTFRHWGETLLKQGDPRAADVLTVARILEEVAGDE